MTYCDNTIAALQSPPITPSYDDVQHNKQFVFVSLTIICYYNVEHSFQNASANI